MDNTYIGKTSILKVKFGTWSIIVEYYPCDETRYLIEQFIEILKNIKKDNKILFNEDALKAANSPVTIQGRVLYTEDK